MSLKKPQVELVSSNGKNPALLPNGFVDLLPPEAETEANAIGKLMENFAGFGYQRVKPPMLEFEDSLFARGPGAAMADQTFRVMDPVSHRMMAARSDITPQIARISSSRLVKEPRPLRLCYANDVLRTKASQQRTERQYTQVGGEIIGDADVETDIESCVVALIGLDALNVKQVTIDLAFPKIIDDLFEEYKISTEDRDRICAVLRKRNIDGLKIGAKKLADILAKMAQASGPAEKCLTKLAALELPAGVKKSLKRLEEIYQGVKRAVSELKLDVVITIDPVEHHVSSYYSGFGYTLFARGVMGELGHGGRYDVHFGGRAVEGAAGFTLYMDTLKKVMPPAKEKSVAKVGYKENWRKIRERQKKGVIVVRGKGK